MNRNRTPQDIELDCPYCEAMVACREFDDIVTCPHCDRKCRQENEYIDGKGKLIFALVPLDAGPADQHETGDS